MQQPELKKGNVFLCSITHNGLIDFRMAGRFFSEACDDRAIVTKVHQTSLLASACNHLWCEALNMRRDYDLQWFALLHADIVPEPWFLKKLIELAEKHDADVMSAVVPIKDKNGVTSTAISGVDEFQRLARLTMTQVLDSRWPTTFDISMAMKAMQLQRDIWFPASPKLLVNTGCMVARLDRPWCSEAYFTIQDRVRRGLGGTFFEEVESEDWFFSRKVAENGGKVMATTEVVVEHIGGTSYPSDKIWGEKFDPAHQITTI